MAKRWRRIAHAARAAAGILGSMKQHRHFVEYLQMLLHYAESSCYPRTRAFGLNAQFLFLNDEYREETARCGQA